MKAACLIALAAGTLFAQAPVPMPLKITEVVIIPEADNFDVNFNQGIAGSEANLSAANLLVTPATVQVTAITRPRSNVLRVAIAEPLEKGTEVTVSFTQIQTADGRTAANLSGAGVAQTFEDFKQGFLKMQASPKKSDEKNIFASGFVTTAKSGTQGGADISLNPDLGIPGLVSFLQIKKSTQAGADPRNFEAGARYRQVFATARSMFAEIGREPSDRDRIREILAAHQKNFWNQLVAGSVVDFASKLEGQATSFEIANFVGESSFQWRTRTKKLAGRHGFWRGFLLPAAMEGGKSLSAQSVPAGAPRRVEWLARYKAGLGVTFFYENWSSQAPVRRIELEANGVARHLFFDEYLYDPNTKLAERTGKGVRGYGQVDLKVYVGQTEKARYGVRLSYNRGSLPPVYARVKSFQFGFLFETTDDRIAPSK